MEGDEIILNNKNVCVVSDVFDTKKDRVEVFISGTSYSSGFQISCFDNDMFQLFVKVPKRD